MRELIGLLALAMAACSVEPPGADEILCGWELVQVVEAGPDRCALFRGTAAARIGDDSCEARDSGAECMLLMPGESARVYSDPTLPAEPRLTHGSCETLACP